MVVIYFALNSLQMVIAYANTIQIIPMHQHDLYMVHRSHNPITISSKDLSALNCRFYPPPPNWLGMPFPIPHSCGAASLMPHLHNIFSLTHSQTHIFGIHLFIHISSSFLAKKHKHIRHVYNFHHKHSFIVTKPSSCTDACLINPTTLDHNYTNFIYPNH